MSSVKLSDSEWKVMQVLWQKSPRTMREILDALSPTMGWSKHTVISFLKRLKAKEAIFVQDASPARLYAPLVNADEALREATESMVDKLYGGNAALLVQNLVQQQLSDEEIDDLMAMLQNAKRGESL